MPESNKPIADDVKASSPPEEITAANCYRFGHVLKQMTGTNLAFCLFCNYPFYREIEPLGVRR